jgi:hypothetical protein
MVRVPAPSGTEVDGQLAATGRSRTYRYYTCFSRIRYGTHGCDAARLPANDTAVHRALADFYTQAQASSPTPSPAPRRGTVTATGTPKAAPLQAQIKNKQAAIDRSEPAAPPAPHHSAARHLPARHPRCRHPCRAQGRRRSPRRRDPHHRGRTHPRVQNPRTTQPHPRRNQHNRHQRGPDSQWFVRWGARGSNPEPTD